MDARINRLVCERARNRCEYCHLPEVESRLRFHVEHIRARQHHGSDVLENLAFSCPECNFRKGPNLSAVDPENLEIVLLFNPRVHPWADHFRRVGNQILGKTVIGRATAELLQFNNPQRLRARELVGSLQLD